MTEETIYVVINSESIYKYPVIAHWGSDELAASNEDEIRDMITGWLECDDEGAEEYNHLKVCKLKVEEKDNLVEFLEDK